MTASFVRPVAGHSGAGMPRTVSDIIQCVRLWVTSQSTHLPEFCGAHLVGSITRMSPETVFPLYRDVDLIIVVREGAYERPNPEDLAYDGMILEVGYRNLEEYASPERVLAHPEHANISYSPILADPLGLLAHLQQDVARAFARPEWVRARCTAAREQAEQAVLAMLAASGPDEAVPPMWGMLASLAEMLAVARLRAGTHRRAMTLLKDELQAQGRLDLHEEALAILGSGQMSRVRIEGYLHEAAVLFDRALEVKASPGPYTFKLHPFVRPYLVEGAREMIDEGHHREAFYWVLAMHSIAVDTLGRDAPGDERPEYAARTGRMLAEMGWLTPEQCRVQALRAQALADEISTIAEHIVDGYTAAYRDVMPLPN